MLALHSLTGGVRPPAAPQPAMSVVDIAANGAGAVVAGYLAGAAAGPAISASAATATGLRNGARPPMLRTSVAVAAIPASAVSPFPVATLVAARALFGAASGCGLARLVSRRGVLIDLYTTVV